MSVKNSRKQAARREQDRRNKQPLTITWKACQAEGLMLMPDELARRINKHHDRRLLFLMAYLWSIPGYLSLKFKKK